MRLKKSRKSFCEEIRSDCKNLWLFAGLTLLLSTVMATSVAAEDIEPVEKGEAVPVSDGLEIPDIRPS